MIERKIADELNARRANLTVILPSGVVAYQGSASAPVLRLKTKQAVANLLTRDIGALGGDYVNGDLELEGTPRALMDEVANLVGPTVGVHQPTFMQRLMKKASSISQDRDNVQFHYDVSDRFYQLWLDEQRVYSCAYYKEGDDLERAQVRKLEHICRKLDLSPGERFLDIGMGWGGLLFHAARHYDVQAKGITLSENQYKHVSRQIARHGLSGQVSVELVHYKDLPTHTRYDKIASIGMSEHVGTDNLPDYFNHLRTILKPTGMLLNHCITASSTTRGGLGHGMGDFIGKYIFPGGELQHTSEILRVAADAGLEMVDTENLRPHYAKTLWDWSDRLERNLHAAGEVANERTVRAYRMYLAGCALGFEKNWISLHQFLFKRECTPYAFNREYMYAKQ